mmetsp:Transcript_8392/g.13888  ORF Transcript_8392/g.13888 Transcript_8392/m.13888 type:complete len:299 (-) Transcript_8392:112-1008(-)
MKAGAEVHFLAGQIFTLGVAAVAIAPRMPSDDNLFPSFSVGGRLSFPFRRALVFLVCLGVIRVLVCHVHHPNSMQLAAIDGVLGTVHVVGQSFLCLATAYLLECKLENYINIEPGRSLLPVLVLILTLTVLGAALSAFVHPNYWSLVNLAEAASCLPVLKTLTTYASVTTVGGRHHGRGPIMVQVLRMVEYWYLTTALLSFLAEAMDDTYDNIDNAEGRPIQIILGAVRHNQENGIDDWTRLLVHSVFLNTIDEMEHFSAGATASSAAATTPDTATDSSEIDLEDKPLVSVKNFRHRG